MTPPASIAQPLAVRGALLRLGVALPVIALVLYLAGPPLLAAALPLLAGGLRFLHPDLLVHLGSPPIAGLTHLAVEVTLVTPLPLDATRAIPAGTPIALEMGVFHSLLPAVLLLGVSVAFPMSSLSARLRCGLLAVPLALALTAALVWLHWSGLLALQVQSAAEQVGIPHAAPLVLDALIFLEGGGRWLLGLLAGLLPPLLAGWGREGGPVTPPSRG